MSQPLTVRTETGDEDLDLQEFEARVRKGEVSPQSLVRFPAVTGEHFVPACTLGAYKAAHQPRYAHFARAFSLGRFPYLTASIILLNVLAYLRTVQEGPVDIDSMVRFGGKVGPLVTDLAQLWRLFTANFLHRDGLHIGLNMFVLLNVGRVLENAYRAWEYVWLLVFSGLAAMTCSLFWSDAVSMGASGMVYGCLGGLVVFGLKYRSILPARYRRLMGEAAVPTVLGLLLIGVLPGAGEARVDNWAHVGGLLAGMGSALFMRPKLLVDAPTVWWAPALRAGPSLAVLCLLLFGQVLFGSWLPVLRVERDDHYGIAVPIPRDWRRGANRLGQLAYYNGLPGLGRATFAAEAIEVEDPSQAARRFLETSLQPQALGPEVLKVTSESPVAARVAERDALLVRARFEEPFGATYLMAYFVPRGAVVYQLVFSYPAMFPRYSQVVEQMVGGIRFEEPRRLREARARALLFPNAGWAMGALGERLRRHGDWYAAVEALRVGVQAAPSDSALRAELALALLQIGALDEACAAADAAILYAPQSVPPLAASARCEFARGAPERALAQIRRARQLAPADAHLASVEAKLREAMGADSPPQLTPP